MISPLVTSPVPVLGCSGEVGWFAYIGAPRPTPAISNDARQVAMILARRGFGLRASDRSTSDDAAVAAAVSAGGPVRRYTARRGPAGGFDAPLRRFRESLRAEAFDAVLAAKPGAQKLTPAIRDRLVLLAFQILGDDLMSPVRLLVVHTPPHARSRVAILEDANGSLRGAAGVAASIAAARGVPVLALPASSHELMALIGAYD